MGNSLLLDIYEFHNIDFIEQMKSSHTKKYKFISKKVILFRFFQYLCSRLDSLIKRTQKMKNSFIVDVKYRLVSFYWLYRLQTYSVF